jgi:hypothetical protein
LLFASFPVISLCLLMHSVAVRAIAESLDQPDGAEHPRWLRKGGDSSDFLLQSLAVGRRLPLTNTFELAQVIPQQRRTIKPA